MNILVIAAHPDDEVYGMGGTIAKRSEVGDEVHEKDVLGVMEAMKMRQSIACPANGSVKEVRFAVGDRVNAGDVMFVIE